MLIQVVGDENSCHWVNLFSKLSVKHDFVTKKEFADND